MSRMTYSEAIETVLRRETELHSELIVLRPGAKRALEENERDVPLPRLGDDCFSMAVGAALYGMRPVLDLRSEPDAAAILLDAVCALAPGLQLTMTVITGAEEAETLAELPGVRMFCPKSPRQAAGFTRAALRSDRICLLAADEALLDEEDEIPGEDDFMLMPLSAVDEPEDDEPEASPPDEEAASPETTDEPISEEAASPETSAEHLTEEAASSETTDEPITEEAASPEMSAEPISEEAASPETSAEPVTEEAASPEMSAEPITEEAASEATPAPGRCSMRSVPWNPARLHALSEELSMPEELLIARCIRHAADGACVHWACETDSLPGECVFLPVEGSGPVLWIGCDRLCMTWNEETISREAAARIMRKALSVLEKPTLLIYDRERENR